MNQFEKLFQQIIPYDIKMPLKRYGNMWGDGGYVFSVDMISSCDNIYSYGIGPRPDQILFDLQMANYGKKVYMYDGTIQKPASMHSNFIFKKENVSSDNIYRHIIENGHENETNLTAQIDIEGCEYELFLNCDDKLFSVFSQMNVEFHDMLDYSDEKMAVLKKLAEKYYVFHIHLNNWMLDKNHHPNGWKDGYASVYEVSYIRKDVLNYTPELYKKSYPIKGLDVPNRQDLQDPEINWWN